MAGETGKRYAPFFSSESNIFSLLKIDLVCLYMSMEQAATSVAQYRICFSYYLCDGPAISNVLFHQNLLLVVLMNMCHPS